MPRRFAGNKWDIRKAYWNVFRCDLDERIRILLAEYGDDDSVVWELTMYGYSPKRMESLLSE